MFAFPLWNNSLVESVKKANSDDRSPTPCSDKSERSSDDDEDMEEFVEKQRNARLGCRDNTQQVSVKSRRYSTPVAEEKLDDDRKFNRRSKRRHSRSSSKSSNSTKYSSAGKTSDTDNEKIIKETIYEVTGSAPPISFSFFEESNKLPGQGVASENGEDLYMNSSIVTEELNEPTDPIIDDHPDHLSITDDHSDHLPINDDCLDDHADSKNQSTSFQPSIPKEEIESPCREMENRSTSSKERHITKLTILLSPVRNAETCDQTVSEADKQHTDDISDNYRAEECGSAENNDTCLYSVIDKNSKTSSVSPTRSKSETENDKCLDENPHYAELSEFQTCSPVDEVTNMEYCQHRAKHKMRFRKISLRRKRRAQPSLKKMNLNINRAWKSIRGWWHDEKTKLGHLRPKSFINDPKDSLSSSSERSFYESIGHLNVLEEKHYTTSQIDEDGYCTLEPKSEGFESETDKMEGDKTDASEFTPVRLRRKPPHPPPLRMSGVNAFRKTRYTIQVSKNFTSYNFKHALNFSPIFQHRSLFPILYIYATDQST